MNNELIIICYMALCGILFALGGTGDWSFASKVWRRYGIGIATAGYLLFSGTGLPMVLVASGLLCAVLHLGYGDDHSWIERSAVAVSYSVPSLLIHLTIWQLILPAAFIGLFLLSRTKLFEHQVRWKMVEFSVGVMIALTFL